MKGGRNDNSDMEIAWRRIGNFVLDFFYANEDELLLEFQFGSTGLAIMKKLAPLNATVSPVRRRQRRFFTLRSLARAFLKGE